ncbi:Clathrin/coatomer adaptor, adaptin-like protein [Gilbertella persicaria]|uniref:Clathrin/coatomer adaptor, adaptin-like protein n=1 Tax=Gilbertella persicaria TaxID=101096 RepID=UPI00221E9523|nr:Clathrin/coatomer adaptor, adaptin-like protein [Gilbertella persicaria]KAI8084415.1 Clathrin/coatomer adaptor, adaptin-like protein [Gilbertella persicaria]
MSRIQNYLSSEFLASGLSLEFNEFVTKITGAKSKTEESSHVHQELEKLVSKMGLPDLSSSKMKEYLIRLVHCFMLGYKVDFGMIYAIMASQSGETVMDRRVGYLACTLFLEEEHELSIMLINTLQRDLKSQHYLDRCAALNAICYIEHSEMLDNVLDLVIQCMEFPKQMVRKKAVSALYFLYKRTDLEFERIESVLRNALEDKDTSVVFSALSVWRIVLAEDVFRFKDMVPVFYRIHRQIIERRIHASFAYHGVLAPWAQLECLSIYRLYQESNIGSPQELYSIVHDCLHSMEKKVDAAFAIVLECIKLLSAMDPILLASISSLPDNEKYPFQQILQPYLDASNHNLKYLGILAMSYVDQSVWDTNWLDGSLLSHVIRACFDDNTVIIQAIENLDKIMSKDVLREASPALIEALNRNYDIKLCNTTIAYWLLNRMTEYKTEPMNVWSVQTVMSILAETRKNLSDNYVQTQCDMLKQALIQETNENTLREASVHTAYQLLKRTNSDILSPLLVQFAFWTIGQHGYLSTEYTDLDLMGQLQKWVLLVQGQSSSILIIQRQLTCYSR